MKHETVKRLRGHCPRKPPALRAKTIKKTPAPPLMLARQRALIDHLLARLEREVEGEGNETVERNPFLWGSKASAVELLAQLVGLTAKIMEMERGVKEGAVAGDGASAAAPSLSNEEWEIVADYAKRREG